MGSSCRRLTRTSSVWPARRRARRRLSAAVSAAVAAAAAVLACAPAVAADQPWQVAEAVRSGLFDAQTELLLGERRRARRRRRRRGGEASRGRSSATLRPRRARGAARPEGGARRRGAHARRTGDEVGAGGSAGEGGRRSAARCLRGRGGRDRARRRRGGARLAADPRLPPGHPLHPPGGRRDGGPARPRGRRATPRAAALRSARTCSTPTSHGCSPTSTTPLRRRSAASAHASPRRRRWRAGYWPILALGVPRRSAWRRRTRRLTRDFAGWLRQRSRGDARAFEGARARSSRPRRLHRGTVHPGGAGSAGRPADALPRPDPGRVRPRHRGRPRHAPVRDPGGASPSTRGASRRSPTSSLRWPSATRGVAAVERALDELGGYVEDANEGRRSPPEEDVEAVHDRTGDRARRDVPRGLEGSSTEADYDLVEISLDQMVAAVNAGEKDQAEQARLSAYAFFEFGPERRAARLRPAAGRRGRGPGLVRRARQRRAGRADRLGRAGARGPRDAGSTLDEALDEARGEDRRGRQRRPR